MAIRRRPQTDAASPRLREVLGNTSDASKVMDFVDVHGHAGRARIGEALPIPGQ